MHETTGLRERKKAETRAALSDAALALAVERGMDAVTADEIAAAANVSVRTFHNYFASKDEAILEPFRALLRHAVDRLRAYPADEPILDALEAVWVGLACGHLAIQDETMERVERVWTSPAMGPYQHRLVAEAICLFIPPVAQRTGTDPARDLYPNLLTTAVIGGLFAALELRPDHEPTPEERVALLREGFALLRNGFRPPGAA
jgi:AcrR family transcriptional regulator